MCGENSNVLSIFSLDAQGTTVHVASWPAHFDHSTPMANSIEIASRALAYETKSFVINAVGAIDDRMREVLPLTDEDRAFLSRQHGGASIVAPFGKVIAGPMGPGEGILYADINISDMIIPKIIQDFSGHYNRFDIFSVNVNLGGNPPMRRLPATAAEHEREKAAPELLPSRKPSNKAVPPLTSE
jgi:aliphatic nitrilase